MIILMDIEKVLDKIQYTFMTKLKGEGIREEGKRDGEREGRGKELKRDIGKALYNNKVYVRQIIVSGQKN